MSPADRSRRGPCEGREHPPRDASPSITEEESEWAHAAALACLGAGPRRLRALLEGRSSACAWRAIRAGKHPEDAEGAYRAKATESLLRGATEAVRSSGVAVHVLGAPGYPRALAGDSEAPAVLFSLGEASCCDQLPRVAIVGTRTATPYGLGIAFELGSALSEEGVCVVSGLACGIDSAAHEGALAAGSAPVVAVVGTAPDAASTPSREKLRREVAVRGAVVSELAPGSRGAPSWWFAVRNRLIAAMVDVVVVVECHSRGGALHTVRYAECRSVAVAAVPGSVRSPASAGTNALLVGGACTVRDARDVLAMLDPLLTDERRARRPRLTRGGARRTSEPETLPSRLARKVLGALSQDPASLDVLVRRSGLAVGELALELERLADVGMAQCDSGFWSTARG